jgi:hypothetical protein
MMDGSWGASPLFHIALCFLFSVAILFVIVVVMGSLKGSQSEKRRDQCRLV